MHFPQGNHVWGPEITGMYIDQQITNTGFIG